MAERSVLVKLQANIADFKAQMAAAERSVKGVGDQADKSTAQASTALGRMARSAQDNQQAWSTAGTSLAAFGAATVVALGATVKAAMDWESAWAGVTKTLPKDADFAATEEGLRELARTLPATHSEIAAVAEAAGQLGVAADAIVPFTKTMIDLGETTNLSADQAATSLAQMMNVMRTAPEDVGRLGAALVALGNDGASTEADIMQMASYLTGAAALIGASESDVLALSNSLTGMGINAERGGGVMTRVMQDIYSAVQMGGEQLEGFARVAGMSSAEFARAFEADPIRAIASFTDGLGRANLSGENVVAMLGDLGIVGTQDTAVLLQMASAIGDVNEDLDTGRRAWSENTALVEEAAKRYDTTAAKLEIARNNITDAAIEIGEVFLPVLADLAGGLADVAGWFGSLPDPIQTAIGGLAGVAGVVGLASGAFLLLLPRVIETRQAFQTLSADMPGVSNGLSNIGKAAGIAAAIYAVATAADALAESFGPGVASMETTTAALLDMGSTMESVDALFRNTAGDVFADDINGVADAASRLTDPGLVSRFDDFTAEVLSLGSAEGRNEREVLIQQFDQVGQSLALMVQNGNATLAAEQFKMLSAEWERGGGTVEELRALMPAYGEALKAVENEQKLTAESATGMANAVTTIAPSVESIYGSLVGYAEHLGLDEQATEDLIKKTEELGQTLADFINPLGVYTSLLDEKKAAEEEAARVAAEEAGESAEAWEDFVVKTGFSFDEYMRRLEEQVKAQENWQTNMLILAGRVSQGTLDELARMGPEGAPLVAELVKRSDAELDRFDEITALRAKEATDAWGTQLTLAQPVLAAIAAKAGSGAAEAAARELRAGTATIATIARDYGVALTNGVNPLLRAVGRKAINPQGGFFEADGGVVDYYADGGVESHVAQIAPGGAWRVWAEPETGGEAYIPLAPGKRPRSVDIWKETGRRLGMDVEHYAWGGISDVPRPYSTAPSRPPVSSAADATMQKAYDEIVAWMQANTEAIFGGIPGSGGNLAGGGGMVQRLFATIRSAFPRAKLNSGLRPGDSGYHGLGRAVDLGESGFAGGTGRPYLGEMAAWIFQNFGASTKELIYTGAYDRTPDLKNGRPLNYGAATNAQHRNHVHWAMAKGGILNPHVRDTGGPLLPGFTYNGTGGTEDVVPRHVTDAAYAAGGQQIVIHSPITFAGPVYGEGSMRQVAEAVVAERDAVLARDVRSALR